MRCTFLIALLATSLPLPGCLSAEADVLLIIRDRDTGKEMTGCFFAVEKESQTTLASLLSVMPKNLGRTREVDIRRIDSGYRYKLDDLVGYYIFWGPIYTVTDSKWDYYLFHEGYVPVHLRARDLFKPEQQNAQLVLEMKQYIPFASPADDDAVFDAGGTAYYYRNRVIGGNRKAKPVWNLLLTLTERALSTQPPPQQWWNRKGPESRPGKWWTKERVEDLVASLRDFSRE